MLAWSLGRMEEESRIKALDADAPAPPGPLTKLSKWPSWWETLDACASQVRGAMFLPLKCLCREHEVPTAEMLAATYDNTDDQLMALVHLQGDNFATDNHRLWDLLCPLLKDGPAWVWVKRCALGSDDERALLDQGRVGVWSRECWTACVDCKSFVRFAIQWKAIQGCACEDVNGRWF